MESRKHEYYSIGEVAKRCDVSVHTLRYYEKIGVLAPVKKDASGRRCFGSDEVARVNFVKRAQRMQFSLDEIRQLLALDQVADVPDTVKPCVRDMAKEKLQQIKTRQQELRILEQELSRLVTRCEVSEASEDCPILDGFKQ